MANVHLTCNLLTCRKKLENHAYITPCSHIFCAEHNMQSSNETLNACLVCGSQFNSQTNLVKMDLNPNEQYKAMVLTGLNPDQILEIVTHAITFFMYQLMQNNNAEGEELRQYYASLITKYKADLHKQQRILESLRHDLDEKIRETEMQQEQLQQYQKENKKLQMQVEKYKSGLVNVKRVARENSPFVTINSHSNGGLNFQSRFSEPFDSQAFCSIYNNPNGQCVSPFHSHGTF